MEKGMVQHVACPPQYSYLKAKIDLNEIDAKLMRFIELRNEMVMLAKDLAIEVNCGLVQLTKAKEK